MKNVKTKIIMIDNVKVYSSIRVTSKRRRIISHWIRALSVSYEIAYCMVFNGAIFKVPRFIAYNQDGNLIVDSYFPAME